MAEGRGASTRVATDELVLEPVAQSAGAARRYVRSELERLGRQDLAEAAELGVSELTTNAVLHARTAIRVAVSVTRAGAVRISVTDASPALPQHRGHGRLAGTGRGLRLVGSAGRWGVERPPPAGGTGKTVWFEPSGQLDEGAFDEVLDLSGLVL